MTEHNNGLAEAFGKIFGMGIVEPTPQPDKIDLLKEVMTNGFRHGPLPVIHAIASYELANDFEHAQILLDILTLHFDQNHVPDEERITRYDDPRTAGIIRETGILPSLIVDHAGRVQMVVDKMTT